MWSTRKYGRCAAIVLLTMWFVLTGSQDAHAYLDPGVGSFLFQVLIAGFMASLFFVKSLWEKLLGRSETEQLDSPASSSPTVPTESPTDSDAVEDRGEKIK